MLSGIDMEDRQHYRPNLKIFGVAERDSGWIYILKNGHLLKIGKTKNPQKRILTAKTWLPDIEIIGIKPFWNISRLERCLHVALCRYWYSGEWFKVTYRHDYQLLIDGFLEFYDDDRDMNSVDFIYWFNSSGFSDFTIEQSRQRLSLPRWQRQESVTQKMPLNP